MKRQQQIEYLLKNSRSGDLLKECCDLHLKVF